MSEIIYSIIRHALTLIAGGYLSNYSVSGQDIDLATGAITTLVTVGWSIYSKKKA